RFERHDHHAARPWIPAGSDMSLPTTQGSIRRRLLGSLLLGAAVLAVLLYFVVNSVARQVARESQDNVLAASALSVMDSVRSVGGAVVVDLPYSALSMLDSVTDERVFYALWLGQDLLTGYADLPRFQPTSLRQPAFHSTDFLGEEVRIAVVERPVSSDTGQETISVSVAQTLGGQKQTLARISRVSMGIGAGFFLLSAALAMIVARSTIQPLDRLTASVSRRGPRDLRPVAAPVPSEMVPLVSSLNTLMGRLKASLARSEDFIAEAAHRVRTPLAVVRTKADIIERSEQSPERRASVQEMIHAIDESSRVAGQLLDHAMVALRLDDLAAEEIDLSSLVKETVERLRPLFELKEIDLIVQASDGARVCGDAILIQNALHNLLDNAIKYSPSGATVEVGLDAGSESVKLEVRDTGPGFPESADDRLTRRFERGSNAAGVVGSGLGLTIAQDVVAAHGGRLIISNAAKGGACASLLFPLP
ncbi:MAG: sensor histidine kinase, partial [Pseudomonadota bacterium]